VLWVDVVPRGLALRAVVAALRAPVALFVVRFVAAVFVVPARFAGARFAGARFAAVFRAPVCAVSFVAALVLARRFVVAFAFVVPRAVSVAFARGAWERLPALAAPAVVFEAIVSPSLCRRSMRSAPIAGPRAHPPSHPRDSVGRGDVRLVRKHRAVTSLCPNKYRTFVSTNHRPCPSKARRTGVDRLKSERPGL